MTRMDKLTQVELHGLLDQVLEEGPASMTSMAHVWRALHSAGIVMLGAPSISDLIDSVIDDHPNMSRQDAYWWLMMGEPMEVDPEEFPELMDNFQDGMARALMLPKEMLDIHPDILGCPVVEMDKDDPLYDAKAPKFGPPEPIE